MLILYDIVYILFALCYLPFFLLRGKYHRGMPMRLGSFAPAAMAKISKQKVIWLHTVSVGEARAAGTLVEELKREYPDFRLVISTVTKTGDKIAQKLIGPDDLAIYAPLDISFIVKKVISLINPQVCIIAETEIWPNLIIHLARKKVPVVLINGRISSGSFRGYKIIRPFLRRVLQNFSLCCMQTESDARRIMQLGAAPDQVKVTGNMKFDLQKPQAPSHRSDLGLAVNQRLLIAGSTHRGEERIILQAYQELIKNNSNLRLLIAPRHIERAGELESLICGFGFKPQRISQLNEPRTTNHERRTTNDEPRTVLILDTIGQLKNLYALADIVVIGGSLIRYGGQNPIEAAIFARPILFGPYMFNFSSIAELFLKRKAALMVKDTRELQDACSRLLKQAQAAEVLGQKAQAIVQENRGATLRNLELIKGYLNRGGTHEG